jgi:hypothetical protein
VPLNGSVECKRFSLREVLIVDAIDLDVWIFTPVPMVDINCHCL